MAQLNAPKAFDGQTIDPKVLESIKPLVEHINQNFDQLIRAASNQLTLSENVKGKTITIQVLHNQPTKIEKQKDGISSILPLKVDSDGIKGFKYQADATGVFSVTCQFVNPIPIPTRSATKLSAGIMTHEIQSALTVARGDSVVISGYSNKSNNGDYLVLGRTANQITVYNPTAGAATEAKAGFTGTAESAKAVTLYLFG